MENQPGVTVGAQVYMADEHHVGHVTETFTNEFIVQEGSHRYWSFRYSDVASVLADRVTMYLGKNALDQQWNVIILTEPQHHHQRHVTQVGLPPTHTVPFYDEVQTTTGGPPDGESIISE